MTADVQQQMLFSAIPLMAILSSLSLNFATKKTWISSSRLTYWIVNVGAIPTLLVSYGLYAFLTYVPVDCYTGDDFGFWCPEPDVVKFEIAFMWILILPLVFVCFAIPITIWFERRQKSQ